MPAKSSDTAACFLADIAARFAVLPDARHEQGVAWMLAGSLSLVLKVITMTRQSANYNTVTSWAAALNRFSIAN